MKLTIVATKQDGGHQQELKQAAERRGIDVSIKDISAQDVSSGKVAKLLSGAVIWRSSSLNFTSERTSLLPLIEKKTMASDSLFVLPMSRFKYFQQQLLRQEATTKQWSIPTYRFKTVAQLKSALKKGTLTLPLIAKPDEGSRGSGIVQIKSLEDMSQLDGMSKYVFQEFIPNDCDWRIIVVGGAPIGVLRRQAPEGGFLNNVSKGATATEETDEKTRNQLNKIATKVASLFHLSFCGVDIIRNKETGDYSVLEVNTAPQWRDEFGFKNVTGQDVPERVIDWVEAKEALASQELPAAVDQYYKDRIGMIPTEAFHFASRTWLWSRDEWSRELLDALQKEFIGTTPEEIDQTIRRIVERGEVTTVNSQKAYRKGAFTAHSKLQMYNSLLFKTVFCDTVYDLDIRPYIRKYISNKELLSQFMALMDDKDSVRLLSTHAVNYFYLLKNYFKNELTLSSAVLVSPYELIELLPGYADLEKAGKIDHGTSLKLQIYLLTHAIIGESRFYARKVGERAFKVMCRKLEAIIAENYFNVSLDNKLEFLVCAQICGYTSTLEDLIHQEAESSVSWAGNFVVDTINFQAKSRARHCLRSSEHRNVLFLMSHRPFIQREATVGPTKTKKPTRIIGRLAHVSFSEYGISRAVARVDSGATRSAIAAHNVYVDEQGLLHFTLLDPENHLYTGKEFTTSEYKSLRVKNTSTNEDRYGIDMKVTMGGKTESVLFTLADRRHMLYPVLLGRNFLSGRYQIDISRQFANTLTKRKKV